MAMPRNDFILCRLTEGQAGATPEGCGWKKTEVDMSPWFSEDYTFYKFHTGSTGAVQWWKKAFHLHFTDRNVCIYLYKSSEGSNVRDSKHCIVQIGLKMFDNALYSVAVSE